MEDFETTVIRVTARQAEEHHPEIHQFLLDHPDAELVIMEDEPGPPKGPGNYRSRRKARRKAERRARRR